MRPASDILLSAKSHEAQRGIVAAMRHDPAAPQKHFLAAAHLELVLADDYEQSGEMELARRSRISAASCFWRAGEKHDAQAIFDRLSQTDPARADEIQDVIDDLRAT